MADATVSKVFVEFEDGSRIASDDFVVVTNNDQCEARLFYSADAITLGQALQLISYAYTELLAQLPDEDAEKVREALRAILVVSAENDDE
jgi:hypothetical protein